MKTKLLPLLIISFILNHQYIYCQSSVIKPGLGRGSIESQFNYVIYQSEKLDDIRQVKSWWLHRLKKEVLDSLNSLQNKLTAAQSNTSDKNKEISLLQDNLDEISKKLEITEKEKNSIQFLGMQLGKTSYNSILMSVICILTVFLGIFIFMFKRSNVITVRSGNELEEVKDEFEKYRKRSLEREQKVVRELYDEILKYKNKVKQQK